MRNGLLLVALLLASSPALALRCGNSVISEGDSTLRLSRLCGEPTQVQRFKDPVPLRRYDKLGGGYYTDYAVEPYEIWVYNFGPRRLITRIEIRGGRIERITTGGYGY